MSKSKKLSRNHKDHIGPLCRANLERRRFELLRLGNSARIQVAGWALRSMRPEKPTQWVMVAKLVKKRRELLSKVPQLEGAVRWLDHKVRKELWHLAKLQHGGR